MKKILNRISILYVLIAAFLAGSVFMIYNQVAHGDEWIAKKPNRHIYSTSGEAKVCGTIYDRYGAVLFSAQDDEKKYNSDKELRLSTLHLVGDRYGNIGTATQVLYSGSLCDYSSIDGLYNLENQAKSAYVTLNVDSEANRAAYRAFKDWGYSRGAVLVCNYKTGELLCSCSFPTYDVDNVPEDLTENKKKYDGVFMDRTVSGAVTPGSVMKIVTGISALENIKGIETRQFECDYEYVVSSGKGGTIRCNNKKGCGTVDLEEAFNNSCNVAFAQIAIELGENKLRKTAEELGFNTTHYTGLIPIRKSTVELEKLTKATLAWTGVGQSSTLLNPTHLLAIVSAIANGGTGYAPNRVMCYTSAYANVLPQPDVMVTINPAICGKMNNYLRSNVKNGYGDEKFPDLQFCGKSGTGQLEDDNDCWFCGYSQRDDLPLAAVCVVENVSNESGGGLTVAGNIVNEVMQYFLENPPA